MTKTIVGLFDTYTHAQEAVQELIDNGVRAENISLMANDARKQLGQERAVGSSDTGDFSTPDNTGGTQGAEGATAGAVGGGLLGGTLGLLVGVGALAIPGIGPVLAAGPLVAALGSAGAGTLAGAGIGAAGGGLIGGLIGMGIPDEDAGMYAEGVRRGGTLVAAQVPDQMAETSADILERHGATDVNRRAADWRQGGWKQFNPQGEPYRANQVEAEHARGAERVVPVAEEQLQVGKKQTQRRGVRIHTTVDEQPVEQDVTLRDEHVNIERRAADRPVGDADKLFQEQTFEVSETTEEPVVRKQARIKEEVVVRKDVNEHTETVRDTVRRQNVDVEQTGTDGVTADKDFERYDTNFRNHFTAHNGQGRYTYEQYRPVYQYGYMLGRDPNFRDTDWNKVEPQARAQWERHNPGTWEQFKDSIQHAWNEVRSQA